MAQGSAIYVCCPSGIVNSAPYILESRLAWRVSYLVTSCRHREGPCYGSERDLSLRSRLCSGKSTCVLCSSPTPPPPLRVFPCLFPLQMKREQKNMLSLGPSLLSQLALCLWKFGGLRGFLKFQSQYFDLFGHIFLSETEQALALFVSSQL